MAEEGAQFQLLDDPHDLRLVTDWQVQLWWFLVAAGLALLLTAGVLFFVRRKKKKESGISDREEAFVEAEESFGRIGGERGLRDVATEVSLILRRYLARSLGEPALFETQEETVSRHDGLANFPDELRGRVREYFAVLARNKYAVRAREGGDAEGAEALVAEGKDLLEEMHRV